MTKQVEAGEMSCLVCLFMARWVLFAKDFFDEKLLEFSRVMLLQTR